VGETVITLVVMNSFVNTPHLPSISRLEYAGTWALSNLTYRRFGSKLNAAIERKLTAGVSNPSKYSFAREEGLDNGDVF
jgi:hypothetical protein